MILPPYIVLYRIILHPTYIKHYSMANINGICCMSAKMSKFAYWHIHKI